MAIGAGSAVSSHMAQTRQANEQNAMHARNRANALASHGHTNVALGNRQIQEMDAANAEKFETALEGNRARATAKVAAGESGVSGLSVDGLLRDFYGREGRYNDRVDQNTEWTTNQLQLEKTSSGLQTVDRINSVPTAKRPSFLDAGLRIAGAGLDSFAAYKRFK